MRVERIHPLRLESPFCSVEFILCVGIGRPRSCRAGTIKQSIWSRTILVELGALGVRRITKATDLETVLHDLISGQYNHPIRVIAFNTAERWPEDVSEDVASEIRRRCDLQMCDVPSAIQDFVESHEGGRRQLTLRLV